MKDFNAPEEAPALQREGSTLGTMILFLFCGLFAIPDPKE
jgi:hypothetical protein